MEHPRQFKNMLNGTKLIQDFGSRLGTRLPNCRLLPVLGFCVLVPKSRGLSLIALTCPTAKTADGTRSAAKLLGISGLDFA